MKPGLTELAVPDTNGRLWGRPRDVESKYLLTGLIRGGQCGGGLYVKSRDHRSKRALFYGCSSYHKRGGTVCSNHLELPLAALDYAVLECIAADVLQPAVIQEAIERALVLLAPERREADAERARAELAGIEAELERLSAAIAAGVPLDAVVAAIQDRQGRREALQRQLAALERSSVAVDLDGLRGRLEGKLADWRGLLSRHVTQTRQVLRKLLPDPMVLLPNADMRGAVLKGTAAVDVLISGLFPGATNLASPTIPSWNQISEFLTSMRRLRDSAASVA